eukprot:scaffold6705_cov134-Isochrysis_galbana.AAC.4
MASPHGQGAGLGAAASFGGAALPEAVPRRDGLPQDHWEHLNHNHKLCVRLAPAGRRLGQLDQAVAHDVVHLARGAERVHRNHLAKGRARARLETVPRVVGTSAHAEAGGGIVVPRVRGRTASLAAREGEAGLHLHGNHTFSNRPTPAARSHHLLAGAGDELCSVKDARQQPRRCREQHQPHPCPVRSLECCPRRHSCHCRSRAARFRQLLCVLSMVSFYIWFLGAWMCPRARRPLPCYHA